MNGHFRRRHVSGARRRGGRRERDRARGSQASPRRPRRNSSSRLAACSIRLIDGPSCDTSDNNGEQEKCAEPRNQRAHTTRKDEGIASSATRVGFVRKHRHHADDRPLLPNSRRSRASWKIGMTSFATKLAASPGPKAASSASPSIMIRVGATGCGATRGGSMTRNCVPPVS